MAVKELIGTVVSDKTTNTRIVAVDDKIAHKNYKKVITRTKRYVVHDISFNAKIGDKVKAISGLFKGDEGTVTQLIPARERVKVLFEILGRPSEVEIDEGLLDFPSAHPLSSGLT